MELILVIVKFNFVDARHCNREVVRGINFAGVFDVIIKFGSPPLVRIFLGTCDSLNIKFRERNTCNGICCGAAREHNEK